MSVRALFEGMIDGARTGETADADRAIAGLGSAAPGAGATEHEAEAPAEYSPQEPTEEQTEGVHASQPTPLSATSHSSPWPNLGLVTAIPCGLIRGAFSVTTGLIVDQPVCDQEGGGGCINAGRGQRSV